MTRFSIRGLIAGYGAVRGRSTACRWTSARAKRSRCSATNGNGKTTLMRCVARSGEALGPGEIRATLGSRSAILSRLEPEEIVGLGVVLVPEGRRLFKDLSVEDNLALGAYRPTARRPYAENLARCFEIFPRLAGKAQTTRRRHERWRAANGRARPGVHGGARNPARRRAVCRARADRWCAKRSTLSPT